MIRVGDDHRAVGELDLEARSTRHHVGGSSHPCRPTVGAQHEVTHRDVADRGPARGGWQRGVQGQRLSYSRPRRYNDHLTGVQTVGQVVEVRESRGDTSHLTRPARGMLDLVNGRLEHIAEHRVVVAAALVRHRIDLGLSGVDDVHDVTPALAITHLHDLRAGIDQPSQHRPLGHDLRVVARVGRGGHRGDQLMQISLSAHPGQVAALGQLIRDGDGVGRFAAAVQVQDRVIDQLVGGTVEVDALESLDAVGDRVLGQQHPADDALLRVDILRRKPIVGRSIRGLGRPVVRLNVQLRQ